MSSTLHSDPTARMTPAQHADLKAAKADPIGTVSDAAATLAQLDDRAAQLDARIRKAALSFNDETALPDSVPAEAREQVVRDAETTAADVEQGARRDLAILTTRARSIVNQLEEAASQPNLNAVPSDVLDGANRFLPLIQSQLAGASLPDIAKRLKAAVIRDDQSELLALILATGPILAEHQADPDSPDTFVAYDLKGAIRQITSHWRDRSLDQALDQARASAARLDSLDQSILAQYQERTGDADPYKFLDPGYR